MFCARRLCWSRYLTTVTAYGCVRLRDPSPLGPYSEPARTATRPAPSLLAQSNKPRYKSHFVQHARLAAERQFHSEESFKNEQAPCSATSISPRGLQG